MSNIDIQYLLTLFPEFSRIPQATVDAYIDIASLRVPKSVWCAATKYATALLTAHMLTASGRQGGGSAGGPVTAEQVGDLSRSYATVFNTDRGDALLATTRYGIDFLQLRKETLITPMVTGSPVPIWGPCR